MIDQPKEHQEPKKQDALLDAMRDFNTIMARLLSERRSFNWEAFEHDEVARQFQIDAEFFFRTTGLVQD